MKEVMKLTIQLQHMTCETNELRGILASYTNKDLNNRLNFELDMLKMEHNQVMSDIQKLPMEISDALDKCMGLMEENELYIYLHSMVLRYLTQLKEDVRVLALENRKLWEEQNALQEFCDEVKKLFKEIHEKVCDSCTEQHQDLGIPVEEEVKSMLQNTADAKTMGHLLRGSTDPEGSRTNPERSCPACDA